MSNNNAQAILYVPSEDKFNEIDKLGINEDLIVSNNGNNDAIITNLELEDMKHETTEQLGDSDVVEFKCKRKVMKRCMKSHRLHVIIVILVILDSLCVSVELIIDLIITVYNQNSMDASLNNLTNNAISPIDKKNSTTHVSTSERFVWSFIKNMNLNYLSILISIETFFKYFGLMILSIFVIEITCKIIFIPRELVRSKWGIFDAIVVFTSFVLDVILLKDKKILHTVSGVIGKPLIE